MTGQGQATAPAASPSATRAPSRWASTILIGGAALFAAFLLWTLLLGQRMSAGEHRRNTHDLEIVAQSVAAWPSNMRTIARANLMASRLTAPPALEKSEGWQGRSTSYHPSLGDVVVDYAIAPAESACPAARAEEVTILNGGGLHVRGSMRLDGILFEDARQRPGGEPASIAAAIVAILNKPGPARASLTLPPGKSTDAVLCYRTNLDLGDVVDLGQAAPRFQHVLFMHSDGVIVAQLGREQLPVRTLRDLRPPDSVIRALSAAIGKGGAGAASPQVDAGVELAPFRITIGGQRFVAYQRPLFTAGMRYRPPEELNAIGLIPDAAGAGGLRSLPQAGVTAFALMLGILLALVPVLKLRLIGPGEAITRVEVWAIGLGLIAATATATMAYRFAWTTAANRATTDRQAEVTANRIAHQFRRELCRSLWWTNRSIESGSLTPPVNPLDVSPVPRRMTVAPEMAPDGTRVRFPLPPLESLLVSDQSGLMMPGTRVTVWRDDAGGRPQIAGRPYFRQAARGELLEGHLSAGVPPIFRVGDTRWRLVPGYALEQVRSQADGISKTIMAFSVVPAVAAPAVAARNDDSVTRPTVVTAVTVLPSLVSPVLPPPLQFAIVDAARPGWPVLFHSNRYRAGVEQLRDELTSGTADVALKVLSTRPAPPQSCRDQYKPPAPVNFGGLYDGRRWRFTAQMLPGTSWVLIVSADLATLDRTAARAVQFALALWFGIVVLVLLIVLLLRRPLSRLHRREEVQRLMPRRRSYERPIIVAATGLALALLVWLVPSPAIRIIATLVALLIGLRAVIFSLPRRLVQPLLTTSAPAGGQGAERRHARSAIAALMLVGVVPASALYSDAAAFVANQRAVEDTLKAKEDAARSHSDLGAAVRAFDVDYRRNRATVDWGRWPCQPGLPGKAGGSGEPFEPGVPGIFLDTVSLPAQSGVPADGGLTRTAWHYVRDSAQPPNNPCISAVGAAAAATSLFLLPPLRPATPPFPWIVLLLVGGLALGLMLWMASHVVLRDLFGFGVPLAVVPYPTLTTDTNGRAKLPPGQLTMVVGAPLGLQQDLLRQCHAADMSVASDSDVDQLRRAIENGEVATCGVAVFNLEMTYRDPVRRRQALGYFEQLVAAFDTANDVPGAPPIAFVFLVELAPLDRLLQAYEREEDDFYASQGGSPAADGDQARESAKFREALRWSRLLERFHTYMFRAERHVTPLGAHASPGERTAVEELAFMPEHVIASLLETPPVPPRPAPGGPYRLSQSDYAHVYDEPVRNWAAGLSRYAPSDIIDFLRSLLVEHYEYRWAVSSWAERLVLHHFAHGRFVNVSQATAIASLVRRGLVVLHPAPRLVNESFALFIRQTEKPKAIQRWRANLGQDAWKFARWPVLAVAGVAVLALTVVLIRSNEPLLPLLPLLIAAGPALLQMLGLTRR